MSALLEDLDSLPYPAWELFPLEEVYFKNSMALFSEEGMVARRRLERLKRAPPGPSTRSCSFTSGPSGCTFRLHRKASCGARQRGQMVITLTMLRDECVLQVTGG